jgi:hypothetical protein
VMIRVLVKTRVSLASIMGLCIILHHQRIQIILWHTLGGDCSLHGILKTLVGVATVDPPGIGIEPFLGFH